MKKHSVIIFSLPMAAVLLWKSDIPGAFAQEAQTSAKSDASERPASQSASNEKIFPKAASSGSLLIAPEIEQKVIDRFRGGYSKLGNPRIALLLNRDLVRDLTVLTTNTVRATTLTSNTAATVANTTVTVTVTPDKYVDEHTGRASDRDKTYLRDKQTLFDVERLFSSPLSSGGSTLVDLGAATYLLPDKPEEDPTALGAQGRRERAALMKAVDVVVQILISTKPVAVRGLTSVQTHEIPDIQAKAIRLSDSVILGQVTASDFIGSSAQTHRLLRMVGIHEIVRTTALALMDDIMMKLASKPEQAVAMIPPAPPPAVTQSEPPSAAQVSTETSPIPQPGAPSESSLSNSGKAGSNDPATMETNTPSPPAGPGEVAGRKPGRGPVVQSENTPMTNLPPTQETFPQGSTKTAAGLPLPVAGGAQTNVASGEVAGRKPGRTSTYATKSQPTGSPASGSVPRGEVAGRLSVSSATNYLTLEVLRDFVRTKLGEI